MWVSADTPDKKLRIAMAERDIEALDLTRSTFISLSMVEKLRAGIIIRPGRRTALAINDFFNRRIYSIHSGRAQTKRNRKTL